MFLHFPLPFRTKSSTRISISPQDMGTTFDSSDHTDTNGLKADCVPLRSPHPSNSPRPTSPVLCDCAGVDDAMV